MQSFASEVKLYHKPLHAAGATALKAALQKKIWGLPVDKLNARKQRVLIAKKASCLLNCISKSVASPLKVTITYLYSVHCETKCVVLCPPLGSPVQDGRWCTAVSPVKGYQADHGAGGMWYMWRGWETYSPSALRKGCGEISMLTYRGRYRKDETRLFSEVPSNNTMGSGCKFETQEISVRNFS